MVTGIRVLKDEALPARTDALRRVYVDAFCAPPWNEEEDKAEESADLLPANARRPGFTAVPSTATGLALRPAMNQKGWRAGGWRGRPAGEP